MNVWRRLFVNWHRILGWGVFVLGGFLLLKLPVANWEPNEPVLVSSATALETAGEGPLPEDRLSEVHTLRLTSGEPKTSLLKNAGGVSDFSNSHNTQSKAV